MFRVSRVAGKLRGATVAVYLADLPGKVKWPAPIRRRVQEHFDKFAAASAGVSKVEVQWTSRAPKLGRHDLLVYFVKARDDTVVRGLHSTASIGTTGTTVIGSQDAASEVYLAGRQDDPKGLGNLAVHELMHNATGMNNSLHSQRLISLAKKRVTADTPLAKGDTDLMSKYLTRHRRQWIGGFMHYHDPMR